MFKFLADLSRNALRKEPRLTKKVATSKNSSTSYGELSIDKIRRTIERGSLNELTRLYKTMLDRDLRIAGDIKELQSAVLEMEAEIICEDEKISAFASSWLFKKISFNKLLLDLTSAIGNGFCVLDLVWEMTEMDGSRVFVPTKTHLIEHSFFDEDEHGLYFISNFEKIYVRADDPKFLLHLHPSSHGTLKEWGLLRKIAWAFTAKHFVIGQYLNYTEILGVPPIIAHTANASDEAVEQMIEQMLSLRSAGVGVFSKDDLITLFEGRGGSDLFMRFIAYIDSEISHLIVGGFSSNGTESGNNAKEDTADNKTKRTARATALLIEESLNALLAKVVEMNFSNTQSIAQVKIEARTTQDLAYLLDGVIKAQQIGLKVSASWLRERTQIPAPNDAGDELQPVANDLVEFNKLQNKEPNQILYNEIERNANRINSQEIEKEILNSVQMVLNGSQTYEEALERLSPLQMEQNALERTLATFIANSAILGNAEVNSEQ